MPPRRPKIVVEGLVLAPGASAGRDQSGLVRIEEALDGTGIQVRRIDFPYRLAGRRSPDRPAVLVAAFRQAAEDLAGETGIAPQKIALGGRSMGGRIASMAVAAGCPAACLVLVSYPLHPPGKPERLRTDHFPEIGVPCLFVSGTRDSFASPGELEQAVGAIRAQVTIRFLEGADHGLARAERAAADEVRAFLLGTLRARSGPDLQPDDVRTGPCR